LHYNQSILIPWRCRHADERRNARLPGSDYRFPDRKWKLLIIRNLLARPWRFNELKKDLDGISQKVLTDSLRSLENDGLITRTVYPEVPPRVEYALSELGLSMKPIIASMEAWGTEYQKQRI